MKSLAALALIVAGAASLPLSAHAQSVSVRVDTPEFGIRIGAPIGHGPVAVYPAPVYPAPIYPAPVYAPPVVIAPRPVYPVPVYAPPPRVIVLPSPFYAPAPRIGYPNRHYRTYSPVRYGRADWHRPRHGDRRGGRRGRD